MSKPKFTGFQVTSHGADDFVHYVSLSFEAKTLTEVNQLIEDIKRLLDPAAELPTPAAPVLSEKQITHNRKQLDLPVPMDAPPVTQEAPPPPPAEVQPDPVVNLPPAPVEEPAPPPAVVAAEVPPPQEEITPEVTRTDLSESVLFLFEEDCKGVRTIEDAVKVWHNHAGAVKKLSEPYKLRCSNTLSIQLAEALQVEPLEAKELIKAALSKPKAEAAPPKVAPKAPAPASQSPAAVPSVPSGDSGESEFFAALAKEPKAILGAAVKVACIHLKEGESVSAALVEKFLVSLVGKHPVLTDANEITAITRSSRMKLYASAAKTKLTE